MMNTLPELVLSTIFNYLRDSERILTLALVCKKWYNIVHSGASWKKVEENFLPVLNTLGDVIFK